jgi:hypothetical protein
VVVVVIVVSMLSQHQQHQKEDNNNKNNNNNDINAIYSTANIWLAGPKRKPTVQLPSGLTAKHNMDKPCRIAFFDNGSGITMRFLHLNHRHPRHPPDHDDD